MIDPGRIDAELERLSAVLEERTETLAELSTTAAQAEVAFKLAKARALLRADGRNAGEREARALLAVQTEYTDHELAAARLHAQQELLRTLRAQLDALRTLAANVRAQT